VGAWGGVIGQSSDDVSAPIEEGSEENHAYPNGDIPNDRVSRHEQLRDRDLAAAAGTSFRIDRDAVAA
jgi:hypothetical protein